MSNLSTGSSSSKGYYRIAQKCWCGENLVVFTSTTKENPWRRFYRCPKWRKKNEEHYFKWVDEGLLDEIRKLEDELKRTNEDVKELEEELVKEIQKVEAEIVAISSLMKIGVVAVMFTSFGCVYAKLFS